MQEVKAAEEAIAHCTRQLARFKNIMLEQEAGYCQLSKLKASVAAASEKKETETSNKISSGWRSASKAFTSLRSQANAYTDAIVSNVFSITVLSALQAEELQRTALLDGPVARATVDCTIKNMHAFSTCRKVFQAIWHAGVAKQQDVTLQSFSDNLDRNMRATVAVRECWGGVLLHSRRMAAAHACILTSQKLAKIHSAYHQVFSNELAAVVAINTPNAVQLYTSEVAALPLLISSVEQANQMEGAANGTECPLPSGPVQDERAKQTNAQAKSGYSSKGATQTLATTSGNPTSDNVASVHQTIKRRQSTQNPSLQKAHAASRGMQDSPSTRTTTLGHKDTANIQLARAAAEHSRLNQRLTSQHMTAHQAIYMQEKKELDAASKELFGLLHALPQRVQASARSKLIPRTHASSRRDTRLPDEACSPSSDEERSEKPAHERPRV
jgi:hypothetical protein